MDIFLNLNTVRDLFDRIILTTDVPLPNLSANMESPVFGPAKQWKQVHWRGSSLETPSTDSIGVQVIGVDTTGNREYFIYPECRNAGF